MTPERTAMFVAAGIALGVLGVIELSKQSETFRQLLVNGIKDVYAFKEWVVERYERTMEDIEDIMEEAIALYQKELAEKGQTPQSNTADLPQSA